MNELELKLLWQHSNSALETRLAPTVQERRAVTSSEVRNLLRRMRPVKIFAVVVGVLWVLVVGTPVGFLAVHSDEASPFFLWSMGLQVLLTAVAIGIYLYQLWLISRVDVSRPVLDAQEQINGLKTSTLWAARILLLQLPLWTTFYWVDAFFGPGNLLFWTLQLPVTLLFTAAAVWLCVNIRYDNRHRRWFRWLFRGREWEPLTQAIDLLETVRAYREEPR